MPLKDFIDGPETDGPKKKAQSKDKCMKLCVCMCVYMHKLCFILKTANSQVKTYIKFIYILLWKTYLFSKFSSGLFLPFAILFPKLVPL